MTSTSTSTTTPNTARRPHGRRTARSLALTAAAATAATVAVAALGPSVAQADPGDTFVAIGSSQLVQSEDLAAIQVRLDIETVVLNRDEDFSSCLGEGNPWTAVLPGSPKPIQATWTSQRHDDQALYESIAQAKTPAQAKRYAKTLISSGIRACQARRSPWDFHYGAIESSNVGSGYATWAVSYDAHNRPDGGIAVVRKGSNFGMISVTGTWGPADQMMESVAKVAADRLVESS